MNARIFRRELVWLPIVLAALLAIYLPGLGNELVFDDLFLTGGGLDRYRSLLDFRTRMLSYGSFHWIEMIVGDGWWKQRLANLAIHAGVVTALWGFYRELLRCIAPSPGAPGEGPFRPLHDSPALGFAVAFFALNPVAVYAVAYLVQRSILLATFFVVTGLWLFLLGIRRGKAALLGLSAACYILALLSKEHALLAPLAAIPVYVVAARPPLRRLLGLAAACVAAVGVAGLLLRIRYGEILGTPFDEFSQVYLAQLAKLNPEAPRHAYALSVINQAWLFFEYGFRWFMPWSGWMSINLRPAFPVNWSTFPQVLGVAGYLAAAGGSLYLVMRHRDWRALVGVSLLLPLVLFGSEFATVWVQDPFALYRSYLWAIGVPGIVFFFAHGPSTKVLAVAGIVVGVLLGWQSFERVLSMRSAESVFTDAIAKLPDDPRSVGRWFPYINRGNAYFEREKLDLAVKDFIAASNLEDMGIGSFNVGAVLASVGRHREAVAAFDRAERQGYTLYNLPFQRALSLLALGQPEAAYRQLVIARDLLPPSPTRELLYLNLARTAMQIGKRQEAINAAAQLVAFDPSNKESRYLLGMAYIMNDQHVLALQILDKLVADDPGNPLAWYAHALGNYGLKRKPEALADIEKAIRLRPNDPNLRVWQTKINALP